MYETILVATDGSEGASAAVEHAVDLAGRLDASVIGVAVVETRTAYDNAIVDPDVAQRQLRERAEQALDSMESIATDADVPVETVIQAGVPHEEILTVADDADVDFLVVGNRGRSAFRGAILGSTVDAIVRLASVPVLVVDTDGTSTSQGDGAVT